MIERVIAEIQARHSKEPITQDEYDEWRQNDVTKRLFDDLELSVLDSFQDWLPDDNQDAAAMAAMLRQGGAQMVERVLDWSPAGVEGPNDED